MQRVEKYKEKMKAFQIYQTNNNRNSKFYSKKKYLKYQTNQHKIHRNTIEFITDNIPAAKKLTKINSSKLFSHHSHICISAKFMYPTKK